MVLGTSDFVSKPGHSGYYGVRLWVLLKPSLLVGFFWIHLWQETEVRAGSSLPGRIKVHIPHLSSADTEVREGL